MGGWLGLGKRELACREPEQLEKALRGLFQKSSGIGTDYFLDLHDTHAAEKGALAEHDWSSVFILDRLIGMMTVCVCTCVSVFCRSFCLTGEMNFAVLF